MSSTKRKTTDQFVEEARRKHNDKYDYSNVEYKNQSTKVCIICPIHGEFWQKPKAHLNGNGCPECGKINSIRNRTRRARAKKRKLCTDKFVKIDFHSLIDFKICDTESFIRAAIIIHGDKYDYSKCVFTNMKTKVCIICPKHGEFWQAPQEHLVGHGCRKCGHLVRSEKQRLTQEDFIRISKEKWDNKYDYSKVVYNGYGEKVCIICPEHGEFWQTPRGHLLKCGCARCVSAHKREIFSSNTEEFVKKASALHNNLYSYEHAEYINNRLKVKITCKKHGDFLCTPANHLKGRGCPICKSEHYVYEERLYNLLLQIFNDNEIIRQYRVEWLTNNKSFDFYLPNYNLAIEHQGSQHFISVDFLGGLENHLRCVELDKEKYRECKENNVTLLYFSYEPNTVPETYIDKVYIKENEFLNKLMEIKQNGKSNWN